jgi:pyruvate, orthophosphate dikinase
MKPEVYLFDEVPKEDLNKIVLGGKGFGLAEMTSLGLPVPPGIIITTRMCNEFYAKDKKIWPELKEEIQKKVALLEKRVGKKFGDANSPLLVAVRSGAMLSMPGMMDTVLNLGINDQVVKALAIKTGDERFAYDTYRRFIQLFGKIVMSIPGEKFDHVLEGVKKEAGVKNDMEVKADSWKEVVKKYRELLKKETGKDIPQDPMEQMLMSVGAVFNSWWGKRAIEYRKIYKISDSLGTAVNIVTMVFGNLDDKSGTGVAFTRNPSTGEKIFYGEYLMKAQGEDVVAGIRTPSPIIKLSEQMPDMYGQLEEIVKKLEGHFKDMQDFEFTIESGKLYMLQTRNGKRTAAASVEIAIAMEKEGMITKEEALLRVEPDQLMRLLYKQIDPKLKQQPIVKGLPASPGAAVGKIVFTVDDAQKAREKGEKIILVRPETMPEDIAGIAAADGVLTSRGGMTSHAAVVTRGMGKPCIVGAEGMHVNVEKKILTIGDRQFKHGEVLTIDGGSGSVFVGEMALVDPGLTGQVSTLLKWADKFRKLGVRANADTPEMAAKAKENGAEGIGLARTERMFAAPERLAIVQNMILADTLEERQKYLDQIEPMQKKDFKDIFKIMGDMPVTIRLLDMPLHEFLPKLEELLPQVTELKVTGKKPDELKERERVLKRVMDLKEYNPMMGQRGVRLALTNNEIYQMQIRAVFEAAAELQKETGKAPEVEIMISQVAEVEEVKRARAIVEKEAEEMMKKHGVRIKYKVGSMIETPRAALTAQEIAKVADFFSFGTNDLTQATFAFSREDVETKFMPFYLNEKLLKANPFETLDHSGVGRLVKIGTEEGRITNSKLKIGVCGEVGGDPASIEFFNSVGLDYVSCSPFRVPVARLAAAQAELKKKSGQKGSSTV